MTNIDIDPNNNRCFQDNSCPRLCPCTPAGVLDDESANISAAVDDQRAAADHLAQSEGDVITVAMPIMLGADGQLYIDGSEPVIRGGNEAVQAAVALLLEQLDLRPAPKTNVAWADVSLWIEFSPLENDGSWDLARVREIEDEFRRLLLPLGLEETGSGGWLPFSGAAQAGTRDISFLVPKGTDLSAVRDRLEPHDFGCDWTFELEERERERPLCIFAFLSGK